MDKFTGFIVDKRKFFFALFLSLIICSAPLLPSVNINYDLSKYLPAYYKDEDALFDISFAREADSEATRNAVDALYALLVVFDRPIQKLTYKSGFFASGKETGE